MMSGGPFDLDTVMAAAAGPGAAKALFAMLETGLRRDVGTRLMTASVFDIPDMRSRRVFTDNPEAYPLGGFKPVEKNRWFQTVIEDRKTFSSLAIEEIAEVFFDWKLIDALGCQSNLNLPAVFDGQVIGTVNLLDRAGHYTAARVAACEAWRPVATLAFLALAKTQEGSFQ